MKYTGIVRRLDSLGRIVIPREYRKMHKINESDPLEIIAMENGDIIIKKVDLSAELMAASGAILKELSSSIGKCVVLSDNEKFLTGQGDDAIQLSGQKVPLRLRSAIESRKTFSGDAREHFEKVGGFYMTPVYKEDSFGALYIFAETEITSHDQDMLNFAAKVLADIMQKY